MVAQFTHRRIERLGLDVGEHDPHSGIDEAARQRAANTAGSAGDDADLAVELPHDASPEARLLQDKVSPVSFERTIGDRVSRRGDTRRRDWYEE